MKNFAKYLFVALLVGSPFYYLLFMLFGEYFDVLVPASQQESPLLVLVIVVLFALVIYLIARVLYKIRLTSRLTKTLIYLIIILLPIILMFLLPFPKMYQRNLEYSNYSMPTMVK